MSERKFTWLHLSDLHVGQRGQGWLWPNFKAVFLNDLQYMLQTVDAVDVVVFSGDLTQRGLKEEFDEVTEALSEIWSVLRSSGSNPTLFPVPGNHDLERPDPDNPHSMLLEDWWDKARVADAFWKDSSAYMSHVEFAFREYREWLSRLSASGIPVADHVKGVVTGDIAATMTAHGIKVGLIGLNTTFLQLGAGNYNGRLVLDVRQLLAVTNNDPGAWTSSHDMNLLVTHHPPSWLKDQKHFEEQIYPPNRFVAHLYGHMHEADDVTTTRGRLRRKSVQAPSLRS